MEKYIDHDMCKKCGGVCCKQNGCIYLPNDFKRLDFNNLRKEIDKGNISISGQPIGGVEGIGWTYFLYLRARNVDADIVDLFTKGGPCKMLTPNGCEYSDSKRPSCGLMVKPTIVGGPCERADILEYLLEWFEYDYVLARLVQHYTGKEVVDVLAEQVALRINEIKKKHDAGEKLTSMEEMNEYWYYKVMVNRPYYTSKEVKSMKLTFTTRK